jgi:hypothetical protein
MYLCSITRASLDVDRNHKKLSDASQNGVVAVVTATGKGEPKVL